MVMTSPQPEWEWDDIEIETLLARNDLEARWTFNIASLTRKVEGVNSGHLIEIGDPTQARHRSTHQSLRHRAALHIRVNALSCNEEGYHRVGARYLTAATGMTMREIKDNPAKARELYAPVKERIKIKDATGRDMNWVESICKSYKPDIVLLDMGDKFAKTVALPVQTKHSKLMLYTHV